MEDARAFANDARPWKEYVHQNFDSGCSDSMADEDVHLREAPDEEEDEEDEPNKGDVENEGDEADDGEGYSTGAERRWTRCFTESRKGTGPSSTST